MSTVIAKNATSTTLTIAPTVGIHLPILKLMIALEIVSQMNTNLNV